ncbi:hypothetical protein BH24ACT22_BH24ACT22_14880 [soil metagenome]
MLKINTADLDLQRKGFILAVVLLVTTVSMTALTIYNFVNTQFQYTTENFSFLAAVGLLFWVNRQGYVKSASLTTAALLVLTPLAVLNPEDLARSYTIMCIPIFILSFLVTPWAGAAAAVVIIAVTLISGSASTYLGSMLSLAVVAVIVYLFAHSLNRAYYERRYQALHDSLTGLPNRVLFLDRLRHALDSAGRDEGLSAVLFLDLDNFKIINDSLGHEEGDKLLQIIGHRLQKCSRPADTTARLGGDEFAVLLENIEGVGDAVHVAQRVASELRTPFDLQGRELTVTSSIGIALSNPAYEQPGDLLRDADVAMYQAKKAKKTHEVFNPSMYIQALERLGIEEDLRRAVGENSLEVYYQPIFHLDTTEIVGVEALLRWGDTERGILLPSEFIPIAEETGLIIPAGEWVLEEACRQAKEWNEHYETCSELKMCVNLSARQFQHPGLLDSVRSALQETGLKASNLHVEITESTMMDDEQYAKGILGELKSLGLKVSIDDFGTGYSSLSYLRDLPADFLKIDQSFVHGLEENAADAAITRLIIDLAHTLGLAAIAEGVERTGQIAKLRAMGCDLGQGYHFSEPLPAEAIEELLFTTSSKSSEQI